MSLFKRIYKYTPKDLAQKSNSFLVAMKQNKWCIPKPTDICQSLAPDWYRKSIMLNGVYCRLTKRQDTAALLTEFQIQAEKLLSLTPLEAQKFIHALHNNYQYGQFLLTPILDCIQANIDNTLGKEKIDARTGQRYFDHDFLIFAGDQETYINFTYDKKKKLFFMDLVSPQISLRAPGIDIYRNSSADVTTNTPDTSYGFALSGKTKARFMLTNNGFELVHIEFENKLLSDLVLNNSSEFLTFAKANMCAYKAKTELKKLVEQHPIYTESVSALIDTVDKIVAKDGLTLEAAADIFENTKLLITQPTLATAYQDRAQIYCKHINWIPYANSLAAAMAAVACVAACAVCMAAVGAMFVLFPPAGLASVAILAAGAASAALTMSGTGFFGRRFMQSLSVFSAKQVVKPIYAVAEVAKTQQPSANTNNSDDPLDAARARGDVLIPAGTMPRKP